MNGLSIGEVARRTGIRASALRFYEDAGVIPAVQRVNGRRRYDGRMLRRIELLMFARSAGFRLAEIRGLVHEPDSKTRLGRRWRALAEAKLAELARLVAAADEMREAVEAGLRCDCAGIEDCIVGRPE